ncbi:MAG: hypothetical protein KBS86_03580 [Proteobacteria bacterium]|nr:hypothetical protein [Candidatus Enterousia scatequi]
MSRIKTNGARNIILVGPNGAGKTAILESLSMLSGDRGMRGADMADIARFDGDGSFSVYANINEDTNISVYFNSGDSNRHAKKEDEIIPLSSLSPMLPMVWLSPHEDRLFVDSVSDRRAFFDRLVCGFDSAHAGRNARLAKLLSERAGMLKSGADARLIDIIDDNIAATAVSICDGRIKYAGEINYFLKNYAISLNGIVEQMLISGLTPGDAERKYREYLQGARQIIADKMVLDGPHKSDFGMFNNVLGLPVKLTSTGQQKMALFDLILAHAKLINERKNSGATILLDEAVAHLDDDARKTFFSAISDTNAQVWYTGIDANLFKHAKNAIIVSCIDGTISNIVTSDGEN